MRKTKLLLLLSLILISSSSVYAEDIYKTKEESSFINSYAGGERIGQIYQNAKLKMLKKGDGWSQVRIDAWVKNDAIVNISKKSSKSSARASTFKVINYSVKRTTPFKSDAIKLKQAILSIDFKNITSKDITNWSGVLSIKDKKGKEVLRSPISSNKTIAPNSQDTIKFAWTEEEDEYHGLLSYPNPSQAFNVQIVGVK